MIELKNVSKTYKSKKGNNTKALDNVTLKFDNKGLTFILGKSGSGKSTLLNVLGGLDKYDSGNMIVLGKSTKDFTQADFDSYRNTYVGFIFQEFNILEDYDVYQNIVLALQLQQRETSDSDIDNLLEKLELTDLKRRKVNELSGGQKQRVAIARALVKNPKIILADEPTGNLDSKTGKQVMELLKQISKSKLVIVVSHDEDYANTYADRIIEIKDGNVVKDTLPAKEDTTKENYKIIKSHLPFKESFKLGLGSLKHKKIKLFFTIILTIATLGFLSCTDTLSCFNFPNAHSDILKEKEEEFIQIEKQEVYKNGYGGNTYVEVALEQEDIDLISKDLGDNYYNVYRYNDRYSSSTIYDIMKIQHEEYSDYDNQIVATNDIKSLLKEELIGRDTTNNNEIVITNYLADEIIKNGIEVKEAVIDNEFNKSYVFKPTSYEDILNSSYTFYFGEKSVKIVGIINYDLEKFKKIYNSDYERFVNNYLLKVYVNPAFIDSYTINNIGEVNVNATIIGLTNEDYYSDNNIALDHEIEYFDGSSWQKTSSLKEDETIISIEHLTMSDQEYNTNKSNYINNYTYNYFGDDYDNYRNTLEKKFNENYIKEKNIIGKTISLKLIPGYDGLIAKYDNIKIIGVLFDDSYYCQDDDEYCWNSSYNYFSNEILGNYMLKNIEKDSLLYPIRELNNLEKISKDYSLEKNLAIKTTLSEVVYYEVETVNTLQKVIFYIGLVFLVFTVILISNFMFNSISYRKKEIGILRALGSSNSDVVKIFIWEGVVLSLISGTIASILLVIISDFLNNFIINQSVFVSKLFIVRLRQFMVIYLVVFIITMISSILPIRHIAKQKPIDAILNK